MHSYLAVCTECRLGLFVHQPCCSSSFQFLTFYRDHNVAWISVVVHLVACLMNFYAQYIYVSKVLGVPSATNDAPPCWGRAALNLREHLFILLLD